MVDPVTLTVAGKALSFLKKKGGGLRAPGSSSEDANERTREIVEKGRRRAEAYSQKVEDEEVVPVGGILDDPEDVKRAHGVSGGGQLSPRLQQVADAIAEHRAGRETEQASRKYGNPELMEQKGEDEAADSESGEGLRGKPSMDPRWLPRDPNLINAWEK